MSNIQNFDVIVIGAGSGGLNVAGFMQRIGLSVLLIDRSDRSIGGDCLNSGCVPSKALIHVSRLIHAGKMAERFGVSQKGGVDISAVMDYVRERQDVIREHENAAHFRSKGMTVALGEARFTGARTVEVARKEYRGKKIVIATGSRPRVIDIPGSEHIDVHTNETIFDIERLPADLVILGGGPIGFEIGQAFRRLGSRVTVLNINQAWLAKEHRDVVEPLKRQMEGEGVSFIGSAELKEITSEKKAIVEKKDGSRFEIPCDAVLQSIGRVVNTDGLALEAAGIALDEKGRLVLDRYLRTTNKRVFAVGDVVGAHQFTHAAEVHAAAVISNMLKPRPFWKKLDTDSMAWVTYTDPEIATFGLSEEELSSRGTRYRVIEQPFAENDRSIIDERTEGLARLYISKKGRLLGGTLVGKDAGELAGELILAQTLGLGLPDIFGRVHPYPTNSRIHRLAAAQFMSARLTTLVKRLLRLLY